MKIIAVLLSVIAAAVAIENCDCPNVNKLVCGSDRRTYKNECVLKCQQLEDPSLKVSFTHACRPITSGGCDCPFIYRPVCGSDNRTYNSLCDMRCISTKSTECICTDDLRPVCGTDAVTYDNECLLECARRHDISIFVLYEGACKEDQEPVNNCPSTPTPICASDGETYNICDFHFHTRTNPDLVLVHMGPC